MSHKDIRSLRHFVAVAETLHFGRAADRLFMTQPPLSQSIQALEKELDIQLFERTKRSVNLTPVGALWLPHVKKLLEFFDDLPRVAQRLSRGEIGNLRLGFVSTAVYGVLPALVRTYTQAYPEIEVLLQEATSDVQIQALLNQELDVGLLIAPAHRMLPSGLEYRAIAREPLVLAIPDAWPQAHAKGRIDFKKMAALPLIVFPRNSSPTLHDLITSYYEGNGIEPCLGQSAVQMQTMIGLVSAGLGFALVPASMRALQRDGVVYKSLKGEPPQVEIGLVWHTNHAPPSVRHFVQLTTTSFHSIRSSNV